MSAQKQGREHSQNYSRTGLGAIAANFAVSGHWRLSILKQGDEKNFAIVDAAMNDLLRPALYSAWQAIIPVQPGGLVYCRTKIDVVASLLWNRWLFSKDRDLAIALVIFLRSEVCAYGFS